MESKESPTISSLYPNLSDRELALAEDNLVQYLELVLRIFEREEARIVEKARNLTPSTSEVSLKASEESLIPPL